MLDLATYLAGTSLTHVFSKTQSRKLVKWMLCINMIVIAWIAHIGIGLENFHDNQHQKSGYNLLIERTQYPISSSNLRSRFSATDTCSTEVVLPIQRVRRSPSFQ